MHPIDSSALNSILFLKLTLYFNPNPSNNNCIELRLQTKKNGDAKSQGKKNKYIFLRQWNLFDLNLAQGLQICGLHE